jgi:DNA polymerase III gamma/tau subunit
MHAYLITGGQNKVLEKAEALAKENNAKIVGFELLKIEHARKLSSFLKLSQPEKLAILIKDIDKASTEALNAFLKNLEEKESFLFILTAGSPSQVLSTIVSRCKVLSLESELPDSDSISLIEEFLDLDTPERLKFLEKYAKRESARKFIDDLITVSRTKLLENPSEEKYLKLLNEAVKTRKYLEANTNPTLQLISFIVSLDA